MTWRNRLNASIAFSMVSSLIVPLVKTSMPRRTDSRTFSRTLIFRAAFTLPTERRMALEPTSMAAKTGMTVRTSGKMTVIYAMHH